MLVTVRYYAMLRDITGRSTEEIDVPQNSDGAALIKSVIDRYPRIAEYARFLRLATDMEYISETTTLTDGDEISLIPPVSGG